MTSSKPPASNEPTGGGSVPLRRREPHLSPPAYVLNKHDSRVLDPDTAVRFPGQIIRPTIYVAAQLLVRYGIFEAVREDLDKAAGESFTVEADLPDERMLEFARENELLELAGNVLRVRVRLVPVAKGPSVPADAWTVLQNFRQIVGRDSERGRAVTLNHLLTASAEIDGSPKTWGSGLVGAPKTWGSGVTPSDEYAVIGYGGRQPVNWIGPKPARHSDAKVIAQAGRRPVVAILDTGVGEHDWLTDDVVDREPKAGIHRIGLTDPDTSPETTGVLSDPLEGTLDSDAGHGTFIAGLIRQKCPDAKILSVRVMYGDGAVNEQDLLDALNWLLFRHAAAVRSGDTTQLIDVISLSFGYYHEEPADFAFDQQLMDPLREFSVRGVVVVAAAGNDATARHMYPAGFAPHAGGPITGGHDLVPLISVGATNPNGKSTALFSNDGSWVLCKRPGAAVISSLPKTFNASQQSGVRLKIKGVVRATIDPDDFRGGFAVWSGTSFAAPILAGQLARKLQSIGSLNQTDTVSAVNRGWEAVTAVAKLVRP
ncbi:subtilase family protein [Jatrophihabitans sp. GAS493]|uniref:S8/S53 family peptidase n=1 Tax=Jatrophihabitans sp. GAS493 TaxID=1907575 RepID=UPI000BB95C0F|nr:S8/S53 family peptidase [Jatrophihabitans sp. GAS493]SOD72362.1 subtilase family protein [Jatrophihabitans sp. GAS493]